MEIPGRYREIITGNMKGKTVNNSVLGPQHIISSYNQKMVLNIGDVIILFGRLPHQAQIYAGTVTGMAYDRFNARFDNGVVASCCAAGSTCIVKL